MSGRKQSREERIAPWLARRGQVGTQGLVGKRWREMGRLGCGPGHLTVREFEPRVRLFADSSEPGPCFGFCVCLSLCPSLLMLSLSLSEINKNIKKKKRMYTYVHVMYI